MADNDALIAKIYDPLLYFALKNIRQDVRQILDKEAGAKILDLCCGTGDQLKVLADAGFSDLTGVDLSPPMLEVAAKGGKITTLLEKDAQHTGLPDGDFSVVMLSFAIHEKTAAVQKSMLTEAQRILKTGGVLLLTDFVFDKNARALGKIGVTIAERIAGGEHYRNFKSYIKAGGLPALISPKLFTFEKENRHTFGAVTISIYRKK